MQQAREYAGAPPPKQSAPPQKSRENGGWNDAPAVPAPGSRAPSALVAANPVAITSPFPNVTVDERAVVMLQCPPVCRGGRRTYIQVRRRARAALKRADEVA
jgi:hypothetical protein